MYKFLLCWRYLRTRYIALVPIISVMLGVATMIVVNSVMEGFTSEMQNRIHGVLSDVVLESRSLNGMCSADLHMAEIKRIAGDAVESMTPVVAVPAVLSYKVGYSDQTMVRPVQLVGIDETSQGRVNDFSKYLQHPENRRKMTWDLRGDGYDARDHLGGESAPDRPQMAEAGWKYRKQLARIREFNKENYQQQQPQNSDKPNPLEQSESSESKEPRPASNASEKQSIAKNDNSTDANYVAPAPNAPASDPFANQPFNEQQDNQFDMAKEQHAGLVLGIAIACTRRMKDPTNPLKGFEDYFWLRPGDDVKIATITGGMSSSKPEVIGDDFTIVDLYESKMSENDSSLVFVPLRKLQEIRGMIDPTTKEGRVNQIQIKLKPGADGNVIRDKLAAQFPKEEYMVETWQDKQGPLLSAVRMETAILNILLFLIIAVAGFGILAIFYMIVVEKTRDIGILKSLGASGQGVMGIFLAYGLSLGLIGCGAGLASGLLFVHYINEIADLLGRITGRPVFDPTIYYFYKIPTIVLPWTVAWIVFGAVMISVAASILPARRAARLHPVEALRYE